MKFHALVLPGEIAAPSQFFHLRGAVLRDLAIWTKIKSRHGFIFFKAFGTLTNLCPLGTVVIRLASVAHRFAFMDNT